MVDVVTPELEKARPDWATRHKIIVCALRHCWAAWWFCLLAPVGIELHQDKVGAWTGSGLLLGLCISAALAVLIIGSAVFGAAWEGARFMDMLARIAPNVGGSSAQQSANNGYFRGNAAAYRPGLRPDNPDSPLG